MPSYLQPFPLEPQAEAAVRQLRTLLAEARGVLQLGATGERGAMLDQRIARLEQDAARLAPDFPTGNLRNGASGG